MSHADQLSTYRLAVVAPCFNEEAGLPEFVRRVKAVCTQLGCAHEIVLVNDGSRDRTLAVALDLASRDPAVRVVNLLRNFGHQAAVTAGLDVAEGEVVVLIDSDLQDPPEVIPAMIAAWKDGADVAYGQRRTRAGETAFKLFTAKFFYRLLRGLTKSDIPADTGDFRLMDRRVADVLRSMRERHRFIRGMVSWVGGRQVAVPYDRKPRFAGETKYPFRRMFSFALDAITSFSIVPLRLVTWLALIVIGLAVLAMIGVVIVKLINPLYFIPGYPSIIITIVFFGGVQLLALGIIGEYLGRMYEAVKARPIYIVEQVYQQRNGRLTGVNPAETPPPAF
jgi:polyisoprenyl-phosphate glycosyltransferase